MNEMFTPLCFSTKNPWCGIKPERCSSCFSFSNGDGFFHSPIMVCPWGMYFMIANLSVCGASMLTYE